MTGQTDKDLSAPADIPATLSKTAAMTPATVNAT